MSLSKKELKNIDSLSRKLTKGLRHGSYGFDKLMGTDGYVELKDIFSLDQFKSNTMDQVKIAVETQDKKRLELDPAELKIRARQGHSKATGDLIDTELLMEKLSGPVPMCVHGTYRDAMPIIEKEGLCRMTRQHIHFAIGLPGASGVISGMRGTSQVLIYVDVGKAVADGIPFFKSSNGVILTPGVGERGILPAKYFTKVEWLEEGSTAAEAGAKATPGQAALQAPQEGHGGAEPDKAGLEKLEKKLRAGLGQRKYGIKRIIGEDGYVAMASLLDLPDFQMFTSHQLQQIVTGEWCSAKAKVHFEVDATGESVRVRGKNQAGGGGGGGEGGGGAGAGAKDDGAQTEETEKKWGEVVAKSATNGGITQEEESMAAKEAQKMEQSIFGASGWMDSNAGNQDGGGDDDDGNADADDDDWASRVDDLKALDSAVQSIREFIIAATTADAAETERIMTEVTRVQNSLNLPESDQTALFFFAAFDADIAKENCKQLHRHMRTLKFLATKSASCQKRLLGCCERFCGVTHPAKLLKVYPLLLKTLYDNDVIEEDHMRDYWEEGEEEWDEYGFADVTVDIREKLTKANQPFVAWLDQADDDDDENESDSDSDSGGDSDSEQGDD